MEERRGAMDHVDAGGRQHPPTSGINSDSSATGATGGLSVTGASGEASRWNTEGQEGLPEGWTLQVCLPHDLDWNVMH